MKLAIVGSRDFIDFAKFNKCLVPVISWYLVLNDKGDDTYDDLKIISGGAKGADSLAEEWAKDNNVSCKIIRPDYNVMYPRAAPFTRNTKIAKECDGMVAFWDGKSRGTEDVIKKAVQFGKQVTIFGVNGETK